MTTALDDSEVSADQLADALDRGERALVIVDVRAPSEVERWRVEGERDVPRIERPYWDLLGSPELVANEVPPQALAVVVCAHGNTSAILAEELRGIGVDARSLTEGMVGWAKLHIERSVSGGPEELYVVQLDRVSKGCLSYVIGVEDGPALVVDPDRSYEVYTAVASRHGSKIVSVVDTHLHADHISGAADLAARTGAPYFLNDDEGAVLEHRRPADGEAVFDTGSLVARAVSLHSPGHTPGSMGVLVAGRFLLSGDTLFVEGVGRPDLGGEVEVWASDLHRTLTERLLSLDDDVVVLPAHYQSRAERSADGVYAARLGDLRRRVEFTVEVEQFLADVVANTREAPEEYSRIRRVNLGLDNPQTDVLDELETGKNQCASGGAGA